MSQGEAVTYFTKSTKSPKASKKQKAISFAALGDVYYSTSKYGNAKIAYDSAAKYASTSTKDSVIGNAIARSKGLSEISGPAEVLREQDSLLALSQLSPKEQQAAVRRYLRYLEDQLEDSIASAQNAGASAAVPAEPGAETSDYANWYFSSPTQIEQGISDFKRKWGDRPLTDNWRRAAVNTLAGNNGENSGDNSQGGTQNSGLPTEDYLKAKIPNSPQQKQLAGRIEERAYMMLAKAYVKQLGDYGQAINTLDTMDARYPDNGEQEEDLYLRYQIAIKQNQFDKAQKYSEALLSKFPHSQYAGLLRPKQSEARPAMASTGPVAPYYDETYNLIMQHQYTDALTRISVADQQYDDPAYKKRFEIAAAMSYAGIGHFAAADSIITAFLHNNQGDTLTAWATTVQEYIKEVKTGGKPAWYKDWPPKEEVIASIIKGAKPPKKYIPPPPPPPPPPAPANYTYKADSEHYCIIVLPGIDSRTAILKKGIKKFDSSYFMNADLNMLLDLYNIDQGVLLIGKFKNADLAKVYMDSIINNSVSSLAGYKPEEIQVSIISKDNYRKMYADKSVTPYVVFYKSNYK